jgi:predicted nucleotidyltransferase
MAEKKVKKQHTIDLAFLEKPWKPIVYSEIQKISGKKSKGYIYKGLERLKDNKMISSERIGKRTVVYSPILKTASSQSYWGYLKEHEAWSKEKFPFQIIENLRRKMPEQFFTLIVTGSYAKGTQTKNSDLDVVIISDKDPKAIYAELKFESETSIPPVHLYVFTKQEFFEMLTNKKENYGKEIARKCLVFFGGASYYSILSEAIEHGFRG